MPRSRRRRPPRPDAPPVPTAPFSFRLAGPVIRALIFDFDGLVVDTETPLIDAWAVVHERAGLACSRADALGLVGHVDIEFDPWAAFGPAADRAALDAEHRRLTRELTARQPILPGVLDYLEEGRRRGLKLAVASSSSHDHVERHLTRLGLRTVFDFIACREDVAAAKPAPEIYNLVVRRLALAPHEAIAFEDFECRRHRRPDRRPLDRGRAESVDPSARFRRRPPRCRLPRRPAAGRTARPFLHRLAACRASPSMLLNKRRTPFGWRTTITNKLLNAG